MDDNFTMDPLLSPADVGAYLGLGRRWVYDNRHILPTPIRINRHLLRFRKSEIDDWIERQREGVVPRQQ